MQSGQNPKNSPRLANRHEQHHQHHHGHGNGCRRLGVRAARGAERSRWIRPLARSGAEVRHPHRHHLRHRHRHHHSPPRPPAQPPMPQPSATGLLLLFACGSSRIPACFTTPTPHRTAAATAAAAACHTLRLTSSRHSLSLPPSLPLPLPPARSLLLPPIPLIPPARASS